MPLSYYLTMNKFRENLEKIMAKRGMSQLKLSKISGVDQSLISKYLRNDEKARLPNLDTFIKLARALNCTLEELTGLESLKGIEKDAEQITDDDLTDDDKKLLEAYKKLDDNDWRKKAIEDILLRKNNQNKKEE